MTTKNRRLAIGVSVSLLGLLLAIFMLRPLLHWPIMAIYLHPIGDAIAIAMTFFIVWARKRRSESYDDRIWPQVLAALFLCALLIAYYTYCTDLQRWKAAPHLAFASRTTLPESRSARLVPYKVAEKFGLDANQEPTQTLADWQPVMWDGKMQWVSARVPDGWWRFFTKKMNGVEIVNASSTTREISFFDQTLEVSEGVAIRNNIRWVLYKEQFFTDVDEIIYAKAENKLVAIVPFVTYEGFLIHYPVFGGAYLVWPDGSYQKLSAQEARENAIIRSAGRVYPESLLRFNVEAHAFRRGFWNALAVHEDQIQLDDSEDELNGQPYLLETTEGLMWSAAAQPWGNSTGIFKLFYANAITGNIEVFELPRESGVTSATAAIGYIHSHYAHLNWKAGEKSGNIVAVEPRPETIQGKLYWMISITNEDFKGVRATCFVNAHTNEVRGFETDAQVLAFRTQGTQPDMMQVPLEKNDQAAQPQTNTAAQEHIRKSLKATEDVQKELKALQELVETKKK